MAEPRSVPINFELSQDQFPHAWYFNRFRIDSLGGSILVTFGLVSESDGTLAVNAWVLSRADLINNRERSVSFLGLIGEQEIGDASFNLRFSSPPARVYPVNFFNLARVDQVGEIGLFRFSLNTLATQIDEAKKNPDAPTSPVRCYPVVMFRCEIAVQAAFVRELYS